MRTQDSFELKVLRALLPLIIYYGVQLVVQAIFGIYAMWYKFVDIGQSDTRHYLLGYQYFDNIQEYLQQHSLVILFLAAVITCPILLLISRRSSEADMHWEPAGIRASGIILFFGIFTSGALGKAATLLPLGRAGEEYSTVSENFLSNPLLFQILTLCIVAPVIEEIVFRGMMYDRLCEYTKEENAILLSALIFGIYHGNLTQGIYAGLLGIFLCIARERCHTMTAPVLLHMSCNTTAFIMMYLPVCEKINNVLLSKIIIMLLEFIGMGVFAFLFMRNTDKEQEET